MKTVAKRRVVRTVSIELEIISARLMCESCPAGIWQELRRKSIISKRLFPPGSKIVMVIYLENGQQFSGAMHWDELPDELKAVLQTTSDVWTQGSDNAS